MAITGDTKRLISLRLAKASGHLNAVQRMVAEEKYCIDILNQLKGVQAALDKTAQLMLKQHLNTCVVDAVKADDSERVMDELWQLLRKGSDSDMADGSESVEAAEVEEGGCAGGETYIDDAGNSSAPGSCCKSK